MLRCVRSIVDRSTTPTIEIVVVADTSTPASVLDELRAVGGDRLSVVDYHLPFNFSDKINTGVLASTGEHVLMLNDDIEVVTPDWLERMVMYSSFDGIGAVGAKLLFGDGRLQHVGVTVKRGVARPPVPRLPGRPRRLRQRRPRGQQLLGGDRRLPDDPARRRSTRSAACPPGSR